MPQEADRIALQAVAPNRNLRYQSAAMLASDLRSVAATLDVQGESRGQAALESGSTSVGRVATMTGVVVVLLALAAWLLLRG